MELKSQTYRNRLPIGFLDHERLTKSRGYVDYQLILDLRGLNNWEYLCSKTALHRNILKKIDFHMFSLCYILLEGMKKIRLKSDVWDMSL